MTLNLIETLSIDAWNPALDAAAQDAAEDALESGKVLYLPRLRFTVAPDERRFLSTHWSDGRSKNIYLRGRERTLRGAVGSAQDQAALTVMIERFGRQAQQLVAALFPHYVPHLQPSFFKGEQTINSGIHADAVTNVSIDKQSFRSRKGIDFIFCLVPFVTHAVR